MVLHDNDVPSALVDFVNNNDVGNIVVGASSQNVLTRSLSLSLKYIILYQVYLKVSPQKFVIFFLSIMLFSTEIYMKPAF